MGVTRMDYMFNNAYVFNQDINGWDVSRNQDFQLMFYQAGGMSVCNKRAIHSSFEAQVPSLWSYSWSQGTCPGIFFDQTGLKSAVDEWIADPSTTSSTHGAISGWDVSRVTDMNNLFSSTNNFNEDINAWDVGLVTNMQNIFYSATAFNQPLNAWDVAQVTSMWSMFNGATLFNQPLEAWDVAKVHSSPCTFQSASAFNQDINGWDVSKLRSSGYMLEGTTVFNQPLGAWD